MGFKGKNGKKLSENDLRALKGLYTDLMEGYLRRMLVSETAKLDDEFDDPEIRKFQELCSGFLTRFDENSRKEEDIYVEDFYNDEMYRFWADFAEYARTPEVQSIGVTSYTRTFFYNFGNHFVSRYQSQDLINRDQGLEVSMQSFKLRNRPIDGIDQIEDFDPKQPYVDPMIEARQANSGTYQNMQLDEDKSRLERATEEFRIVADYAREEAAGLMDKETVEFSDLYRIFTTLNRKLEGETGGKVRVESIAAGTIEGIDSAAIPADVFTTFSTIADHINRIRKTEDPLLRKSQAVQLAAFAYQLTISEHVFGNGNGRSCRLLADTILQTFGLPPQVPNYALIGTGASIGTKLDFEKGEQCFFRGVSVSSDLMRLNRNENLPDIRQKAVASLNSENLSLRILDATTPSNAINLAVQSGEARYSLATYLDDFIKADHFGTRNSRQFKGLIETANKALLVLGSESIYSRKSANALKKVSDAITAYEEHCVRHPRNNVTRRTRLSALSNIKKTLENAKDVAILTSTIAAQPFVKDLDKVEADISGVMTDDILKNLDRNPQYRDLVGKYILTATIKRELAKDEPRIHFEEAVGYSEDERQLAKITDGNTLDETVTTVMNDPENAGKTMQEKLEQISGIYVMNRIREFAAEANRNAEQPAAQKQENEPKPAEIVEEKGIMNFIG